jgi:peptidoglycan/xylan/chitin deacetylase (PgdA/CDA1 family)
MIAQAASAADCPGHPDALGTSRTLVVDPRQHPRIGTMQYAETLPLEDHEVVLTFDDGPLPHNSNQILEILAAECVKATFFEVGQMARAYPEGVRKLRDAGHTIGTHSQTHPLTMNRMPIERVKQEIDGGIASVKAALGDDAALAPFFRIPGLMRAENVEAYLASQGIQTWSADFPADDWRHISSTRVYDLAMQRIEAKGKGILLLHDIQARTVAALPKILRDLKAGGYRIVHVVPATPELPATPTDPQQWQMHPISETVATSHWPKIPGFVFVQTDMLPAPALSDLNAFNGQAMTLTESSDRRAGRTSGPAPHETLWPQQPAPVLEGSTTSLPVPAQTVFEVQEAAGSAMWASGPFSGRAGRSHPAAHAVNGFAKLASADADGTTHQPRKNRHASRAGKAGEARAAGNAGNRLAAHERRSPLKHLVQVKKRSV